MDQNEQQYVEWEQEQEARLSSWTVSMARQLRDVIMGKQECIKKEDIILWDMTEEQAISLANQLQDNINLPY